MRKGAQTDERMILFLFSCSPPLCCYPTLPLFPHLTSPTICPSPSLSPCSHGSILHQLQQAGSHCTEGEKYPLPLLSLLCHFILAPFSYYLFILYSKRLFSGDKGGYFSLSKILSVGAVLTASFPSLPL